MVRNDPTDQNSFELVDLYIDDELIYETKVIDSEKAIYQVTRGHLMPKEITNSGDTNTKHLNVFWFNGNDHVSYDIPE